MHTRVLFLGKKNNVTLLKTLLYAIKIKEYKMKLFLLV